MAESLLRGPRRARSGVSYTTRPGLVCCGVEVEGVCVSVGVERSVTLDSALRVVLFVGLSLVIDGPVCCSACSSAETGTTWAPR